MCGEAIASSSERIARHLVPRTMKINYCMCSCIILKRKVLDASSTAVAVFENYPNQNAQKILFSALKEEGTTKQNKI